VPRLQLGLDLILGPAGVAQRLPHVVAARATGQSLAHERVQVGVHGRQCAAAFGVRPPGTNGVPRRVDGQRSVARATTCGADPALVNPVFIRGSGAPEGRSQPVRRRMLRGLEWNPHGSGAPLDERARF
jgi:hypothetical protein